MAHYRTNEEAFLAGREQGFDRGFEAALEEMKDRRLPRPKASAQGPVESGAIQKGTVEERRVLGLGLLGLLAYGAWRLLRTWPGRIVAAGSLVAFSGLVSLGMAVLAVVVVAVALGWAMRTLAQVRTDLRTGGRHVAAVARYARARYRS